MNSSKQNSASRLSLLLAALLISGLNQFSHAAEPVRLTTDGKMKQDLCFTHDTQELIYSVLKTPQLIKLQRLNLESGNVEDFHTSANTNEIYIDFAKDMSITLISVMTAIFTRAFKYRTSKTVKSIA